jgi:hypothetical protein
MENPMKELFTPCRVKFLSNVWVYDPITVWTAAGLTRTLEEAEADNRVRTVVVEDLATL